jgi:beta-galactosidase GanA
VSTIQRVFTVNGKPFFPVGGQSHNQSGQSAEQSEKAFKAVQELHGNTLLIPVYWQQVEPEEDRFDFSIVDALLANARRYNLKLVLLWFATWKNGNMDYAPDWVKIASQRFKRVVSPTGHPIWVLSSHCQANLDADQKAFTALCAYLKAKDDQEHTIIGLQIENEPGIIGSDRDYSPEAQLIFEKPVPVELIHHLKKAGKSRLFELWQQAGGHEHGSWSEVFGALAGELFTAWSIAIYIDHLAEAGKVIVQLPMYVNVWLHQDWELAGESYPSGGAVRNTLDIYKWFAPHLDLIAPDIYIGDSRTYEAICATYAREDNPFYVPESGIWGSNAWLMFRAVADYNAIGYHCFGVESILTEDGSIRPEAQLVVDSFRCLAAITPLLLKYQGTRKIHAVVQEENLGVQILALEGYLGKIQFGPRPWFRQVEKNEQRGRGLVIQTGLHEFYLTGDHFRLFLRRKLSPQSVVAPASQSIYFTHPLHHTIFVEEGHFDNQGEFVVDHRRNGDEVSQGFWVEPGSGVLRVLLCD